MLSAKENCPLQKYLLGREELVYKKYEQRYGYEGFYDFGCIYINLIPFCIMDAMMEVQKIYGPYIFSDLANNARQYIDWGNLQKWAGLSRSEILGHVGKEIDASRKYMGYGRFGKNACISFGVEKIDTGFTAYYFDMKHTPDNVFFCRVNQNTYRFRVAFSASRFYRMGNEDCQSETPGCDIIFQNQATNLSTYLFASRHARILTFQCAEDALTSLLGLSRDELVKLSLQSSFINRKYISTVSMDSEIYRVAHDFLFSEGTFSARIKTLKMTEIILRMLDKQQKAVSRTRSKTQKICDVIGDNPNQPLKPLILQGVGGMNRTSMRAMFKKETGRTMSQYRFEKRWQLAMDLLGNGDLSLKQISYQLGFRHPANFSTAFRKHFGETPAKIRKNLRTK